MKLKFDNHEYDIQLFSHRVELSSGDLLNSINCEFANAINVEQIASTAATDFTGTAIIELNNNTELTFTNLTFVSVSMSIDNDNKTLYEIQFTKD